MIPVDTELQRNIAELTLGYDVTGEVGKRILFSKERELWVMADDHLLLAKTIIETIIKEIETQAKYNLSAISQLDLFNSPMWKSLKGGLK